MKIPNSLSLPLAALILFAGLNADLMGMCASSGVWTWPHDSLAANGIIILNGYKNSRDLIREIGSHNPRLVSGGHSVDLIAGETNESEYYLTQTILTVSEDLHPGESYRLVIDDNRRLYGWHFQENGALSTYDSAEFVWKATASYDLSAPDWTTPPTATGAGITHYGCGPARFLHLSFMARDRNPMSVEVELAPVGASGAVQKFIITNLELDEKSGLFKIDLGHDMCSGQFLLKDGQPYRTRFTLVDWAGNRSLYPSQCVLTYGAKEGTDPDIILGKLPFKQEGCVDIEVGPDAYSDPTINVR